MPAPHRNDAQRKRMRARIARTQPACHICGKPIDYTLHWPNPKCFVVDHVTPLALGGRDDITNAAAAHAGCNSTKRARPHAPIIRRTGSFNL